MRKIFSRSSTLAVLAAIFLVELRTFWPATIDDAFISFRYAVHWAQGLGLTFNAGERVEGYSNFLWVAILAAFSRLGLDPVLVAKVAGLASLLVLLILAWRALSAAGYARFPAAVAIGLLLVSNSALVFLSLTGLETVLFAALLMGVLESLRRSGHRLTLAAAFLLVLAALARPEGIAYAVTLAPVLWWLHRKEERRPSPFWLVVFAGYSMFLIWRWRYFGTFWPNTFYAKPSAIGLFGGAGAIANGWLALPEIARALGAAGGPLVVIFAAYAAMNRTTWRTMLPITTVVLTGFVFQLYAGPDWMQLGRFLVPIWTPLTILALIGWREMSGMLGQVWHRRGLALWIGVTMVINLSAAGQFWADRKSYPTFVLTSEDMISASRSIAAHYPPDYSIVCWRIGALGYYSGLKVIDDEWGLTDPYIARLRSTGQLTEERRDAYLAGRNPELVIARAYSDTKPPDQIHTGGRLYVFVRRFPQGDHEWWDLYQRSDLSRVQT